MTKPSIIPYLILLLAAIILGHVVLNAVSEASKSATERVKQVRVTL